MGRPALPLGTMGEIRCYPLPSGKVRAVAYFRDFDGRTRQVERTGTSATHARNRLKAACRDRGRTDTADEITPETTVAALAEEWFHEIADAVAAGERSPTTAQLYRYRLDSHVLPAIGGLRLREVTISRADRLLKTVRDERGAGSAKSVRAVLSGMFGLAARHNAMTTNPVRDAAPIRERRTERSALTVADVADLRAKLAADPQAVAWDLPDFVDAMLATGLRIGETAAITWPAVDLDAGTVEVRGTVVRITGQGLVIKARPKSRHGWRTVELSSWAVAMLRRRHADRVENPWQAVFTSAAGRLRDPSNTQSDLRVVLDQAGYPDVTSHTFRRTVATLMDLAGLSARAAADQLGHAKVSMTTDHYYGRRVARTGAADVLEALETGGASEARR